MFDRVLNVSERTTNLEIIFIGIKKHTLDKIRGVVQLIDIDYPKISKCS